MEELAKFYAANEKHNIVSAEWTINGRSLKSGDGMAKCNFMRVKLSDKSEFLLSSDEVKKIEDFPQRWEKRK